LPVTARDNEATKGKRMSKTPLQPSLGQGQFDPYHRWLGIPPSENPPSLYRLLGLVDFEDDDDVIQEASDRQMAHVKRHAGGPHAAESQRLMNELSGAKLTLLNPAKKQEYDDSLRLIESPGAAKVTVEQSPAELPPVHQPPTTA
jgi:hypothetical protein